MEIYAESIRCDVATFVRVANPNQLQFAHHRSDRQKYNEFLKRNIQESRMIAVMYERQQTPKVKLDEKSFFFQFRLYIACIFFKQFT